jgi:hypothetical protein
VRDQLHVLVGGLLPYHKHDAVNKASQHPPLVTQLQDNREGVGGGKEGGGVCGGGGEGGGRCVCVCVWGGGGVDHVSCPQLHDPGRAMSGSTLWGLSVRCCLANVYVLWRGCVVCHVGVATGLCGKFAAAAAAARSTSSMLTARPHPAGTAAHFASSAAVLLLL